MPKSKRSRIVDLCKTSKHGKELKNRLFEEIRTCIDSYSNVFVFSVTDMRNAKLKKVREQWKHSRFFIGKNKVMARAFGRSSDDAYQKNIHHIGNRLKGQCGILFSNKSKEEVLEWFDSFSESDYARSGNLATETVLLREGPLTQFPHSVEPHLKSLGLPTTLKKGVIHLVSDYEVCKAGDVLTPEAAKILKLLGFEMAEFHVNIDCVWSKNGKFEVLKNTQKSMSEVNNDESDEQENTNNDNDNCKVVDEVMDTSYTLQFKKAISEVIDDESDEQKNTNDGNDNCEVVDEVMDTSDTLQDSISKKETNTSRDSISKKEIATSNDSISKKEIATSKDSISKKVIDTSKDNEIPEMQSLKPKSKLKVEPLEDSFITPMKNGTSTGVKISPIIKGEYSNKDKIGVVEAALKEVSAIFSSPDDKSPVYRSLRSRTFKVPKSSAKKVPRSRKSETA